MIVVKSIKEKPKECRGCRLLDESTYDCLINSESPAYTTCEEQYEHCPIEEAPDINVGNMDTTTHDSIPAETGKNDGDRTSGDCISRTQAIDALRGYLVEKRCPDDGTLTCRLIENEVINKLPSAQPDIIRCKDCKHHWTHRCMDGMPTERCDLEQTFYDANIDYCSLAERKEVTE